MENTSLSSNELVSQEPKPNKKIAVNMLIAVIFLLFINFLFLSAPVNFPVGSVVKIESGMSLRSVSLKLKTEHIIRSRVLFEFFAIILGGEKEIKSADYYFENKLPVYEIARRISKGEHEMAPISVTIPEGFDNEQIADTFAQVLTSFQKVQFLSQASNLQGYLFPDTYFFLTTDDEKDVILSMQKNFDKKIMSLLPEIIATGKKEKDIIVMASIVEREANGDADRDIISGILWKRISIGMPLQVDAAPETYKTKGLPLGPICNPGLASIKAAIHPKSTSYLYYLHDKDGNIHYAKSFTEHVKNKQKYLKP